MKRKLINSLRLLLVAAGLCVVGANAWGATLNPTIKMTYINGTAANADDSYGEVTTAYCGYNNISKGTVGLANSGWGVNNIAYLQVDASALPDGATITAASLTMDCQKISARNLSYGVGYHSAAWSSTMTWNTADRSITTMGATQSVSKANGEESKTFDIVAAFSGDDDNIVTILVYQTAAGAGYVKNPSVTITYTTETAYSVTFAETNSVAATVKIGGSDVTSGTLLVNGTYDFTATATGYMNYNGSFTVSGADKEVSFTMTPKTAVTSFTLKYKNKADGSVIDTKEIDMTGCYVGDSYTYSYQKYWANGGDLYVKDATNTRANHTLEATNEITVNYNLSASGNYYFYECDGGYTTRADAESNGSAATQSANVTVPADGIYIVTANCYGSASGRTGTVKVGSTTIVEATTLSIYAPGTDLISSPVALNKDDVINVTTSSSGDGIDYVILQKLPSSVSATIGSYGYATFSSTYALDFTDVTDATAYIATSKSGDKIKMQTITGTVAAGTGLVLKSASGSSATINIPVAASGTTYNTTSDPVNYLFAISSNYDLGTPGTGTNYVLSVQSDKVVFAPIGATAAPVTAGHAALWIPAVGARMLEMSFADDETTGISQIENRRLDAENSVYNLNGQRVTKPSKGLYIVGGKKVILK